jgi:menaquinone-9 beta-reductase
VVTRRLGLRRTPGRPRRLGIVGHWEGVSDVQSHGEMHVEHDGYFGLADVGGGVTNISLVVPASRARELSRGTSAFYEHWLRARAQLAPRLQGARRTGRVMTTGPFAIASRRAYAPGAALVGDAADYFDPFTGEGIFSALRGGELLAPRLLEGLGANVSEGLDDALQSYGRERHREMLPKRLVERAIALFVSTPRLMNHAAAAFARRPDMAALLVGVCGDFVPPRHVLDPRYILRLLALPMLPGARGRTPATL